MHHPLDAPWEVFAQLIDPKAADLPAEALELQVAPIVVVLAATTSGPVNRLTVHFHIHLPGTQDGQVKEAACNGILRDHREARLLQRLGQNFFPRGLIQFRSHGPPGTRIRQGSSRQLFDERDAEPSEARVGGE